MLGIVILNYKTYRKTMKCIDSITSTYSRSNHEYTIYIVDNASPNHSYDILQKKYQQYSYIKVISAKENGGYAKGNNLGLSLCQKDECDCVLISNNDVTYLENSINQLYHYIYASDDAVIVGPKILDSDRRVHPSTMLCQPTLSSLFGLNQLCRGPFKRPEREEDIIVNATKVYLVSGCCYMINLRRFIEMGAFDEGTFLYSEEHILGFQAQKAGYSTYFLPSAEVIHDHGATAGKQSMFINQEVLKSSFYYWKKYRKVNSILLVIMWFYFTLRWLVKTIYCKDLRKGWPKYIRSTGKELVRTMKKKYIKKKYIKNKNIKKKSIKKITIGLLFHSFSAKNLGVGALTLSECEILKKISHDLQIPFEVICFESVINDLYTTSTDIKVSLNQMTYQPNKMIKKLKQCDILIDVTAGDSSTDIYGIKNFIAIFLYKFYAVLSARPIILAPQTLGPYHRRSTKWIANLYLKYVKHIFLRDELSKEVIPLKYYHKLTVSSDMAFRLPYFNSKNRINSNTDSLGMNQDNSLGINKIKAVGFNVSGLLYSGGFESDSKTMLSYKNLCLRIIQLLFDHGYEVFLVPHVLGEVDGLSDNDTKASLELCNYDERLKLAPSFHDPIEAKNYISHFDLFIGSRMHATIAALSSGVATIPLAYSRKFVGVFEPLGYPATLNLYALSEEEIIRKLSYYLEHLEELKQQAAHARNEADLRLDAYENYMKTFIKSWYQKYE